MVIRASVELLYAHRSDRGTNRRTNEDTSAIQELVVADGRTLLLAAVADGMGGSRSGAEASQVAVAAAFGYLEQQLQHSVPRRDLQWQALLVRAIEIANAAVRTRGQAGTRNAMGTTLMVTVVAGRRAHIAHIGDCRAYAVRPAVRRPQITRLTAEHTIVAEMVDQGALSYAEAKGHPQRHELARALGSDSAGEPETTARTLRSTERLVLCSDGLPLHLSDSEIARAVSDAPTPQAACDRLIALANARGGRDNLSAIVISAMPAGVATSQHLLPS